MPSRLWNGSVLAALLLLTGCQSPYRNGYGYGYGYGTPQGYAMPPAGYPAQPYSMQPGMVTQPGYPQGYPPPAGYIGPGGPTSSAPAWSPGNTIVPTPTTTQIPNPPPAGNKLVPNYSEPGPGTAPSNLGNPLDDKADDFKEKGSSLSNPGPVPGLAALTDDREDVAPNLGEDTIRGPSDVQVASGSTISPMPHTVTRPNPFDHDREHYTWLRGVVGYDEVDRAWRITYQADGAEAEPYKGNLGLITDERFSGLSREDVVYVEGYIDPRTTDRFGKPMFRVTDALRLRPKH